MHSAMLRRGTTNQGSSRAQPSRSTATEGTDGAMEARRREIQRESDRSMERERGGRDGDGLREKWRELQREWDRSMERERGGRDGDGVREKRRELQREWDMPMEMERERRGRDEDGVREKRRELQREWDMPMEIERERRGRDEDGVREKRRELQREWDMPMEMEMERERRGRDEDGVREKRREFQREWDMPMEMERERRGRDEDGVREKRRELQREWDMPMEMERERRGRDEDGVREKWRELQREWDMRHMLMERERDKGLCKICMDMTPTRKMFQSNKCSHKFCPDCLSQYITAKVRENISAVKCPEVGCKGVLTPGTCEKIIPKEVFEKWEIALCETNFVGARKFYCPFKNCSEIMVDDGAENVTQAECPYCHRLFCAKCKVAWHAGVTCKTFKSLGAGERGREDLMLMELGEMKKWRRCPSCMIFVEKRSGCQHIVCRCGYEFCYGCRRKWAVSCNGCSGES